MSARARGHCLLACMDRHQGALEAVKEQAAQLTPMETRHVDGVAAPLPDVKRGSLSSASPFVSDCVSSARGLLSLPNNR